MVEFDNPAGPLFFIRFYRGDPDADTKRIPVFDLEDAKARLRGELRERVVEHSGRGKPPITADIIDETGDQLMVARFVSEDRIDAFELAPDKSSVKRITE